MVTIFTLIGYIVLFLFFLSLWFMLYSEEPNNVGDDIEENGDDNNE